jgi:ornithine cyclodeaminase/alanine dehydrogenase-like protein (mu-crystallin family)
MTIRDAVLAAERAYAAGAATGAAVGVAPALAGAVASRYLAVGTPRSFAIIGGGEDAAESLAAHRTWFEPRDVRCTDAAIAAVTSGRVVTLAEALAADIACIHAPIALAASQLRRGTHVNALAAVTLDDELAAIARVTTDLTPLAAGIVDGRQLDEITIFRYAGAVTSA